MQRNIGRLLGCSVHARDGELGTVDDFLFDDQSWTIRYMVVNTNGWLSGREVLLSTAALRKPRWKTRSFPVDLTKRQVKDSPGLDSHRPVSRQAETDLHAYYGWPIYWGSPLVGLGIPMPAATPPLPLPEPVRTSRRSKEAGYRVLDFGDNRPDPADDYPDFVVPLARAVAEGAADRGIAVCTSGAGACVAANKVEGVRACLIQDLHSARQGVEDDDLDILCLGGRTSGKIARELVRAFLDTRFSRAERHVRRLAKVMRLDRESRFSRLSSAGAAV